MRTYTANDGKMADLHKRFREHTNRLFEKHGMTLVAYWTPVDGPEAANTLVYVLAYPSREAREKSWKDFQADPEWQAAYKASHADGPLVKKVVSQFLSPTDYSPIK
ncbi:MAG: NIPSNAP family protein [Planctomycetia bacterium]|nr:NIPSNAP family protein [Planctomycetia bacterium]